VRREAHRNEEATHKTLLAGVICSGRELFRKGEPQRPPKLCAICSPKSRVACARCLPPKRQLVLVQRAIQPYPKTSGGVRLTPVPGQ
jgi:hypothetical protein